LIYWETVPSTNFYVPNGASGVFSPLTLVKNVFCEPWESFGDQTKPGHREDLKKMKKKRKTK
ncbi:hypothetical protein K5549_021666, partial [Capra hircus]